MKTLSEVINNLQYIKTLCAGKVTNFESQYSAFIIKCYCDHAFLNEKEIEKLKAVGWIVEYRHIFNSPENITFYEFIWNPRDEMF